MNTALRACSVPACGLGMRLLHALLAFMCALLAVDTTRAQDFANTNDAFAALAHTCAPNVDRETLAALVRTESGFNPYAIGVVGGHLERQPATLAVALATARELDARGFSYSVGLTQVNNRNFVKYGETVESMFEPCRNLRTGAAILTDCFARSRGAIPNQQQALRAALSCYYSGNFTTGFETGYVSRVVSNARVQSEGGGVQPIPVVRDAPAPPRSPSLRSAPLAMQNAAQHPAGENGLRTNRNSASACRSRAPVVMTCRGLSVVQARAMCVRCLDAR